MTFIARRSQHRATVAGDGPKVRTQSGCSATAYASIEYVTVVTHSNGRARTRRVLLSYRLPREPSSPRIALWRKLKRLGVAQLLDGLVALPLDSRNREQLEWLADEVGGAGGDAMIWIGELGSAAQERELAGRMATAIAGREPS